MLLLLHAYCIRISVITKLFSDFLEKLERFISTTCIVIHDEVAGLNNSLNIYRLVIIIRIIKMSSGEHIAYMN